MFEFMKCVAEGIAANGVKGLLEFVPGGKYVKPRAVKFCTDPNARTKLVTHEKHVIERVMHHVGDHPNIVPLLECHLSGETPWLMYEYVEGGELGNQRPFYFGKELNGTLGDNLNTLRAGGMTIPFADAVIATVAVVNDIDLWTRDAHFTLVQGVLPALKLFAEPP